MQCDVEHCQLVMSLSPTSLYDGIDLLALLPQTAKLIYGSGETLPFWRNLFFVLDIDLDAVNGV